MFRLAVPSIIENILQVTLSTVDTYFVAGIGAVAISAVGVNTLISNLYLTFFIALGTGISILTSRSDGEKADNKTRKLIGEGILIHISVNIVLLLLNIFLGRILITYLAKDTDLIKASLTYYQVVIIPIFGLATMTVLSSILKSLGDTKSPMYTVFAINLINIALDYVLIRGIGSFQGLGILGAGIATTISRFIGLLMLLAILERKMRFIGSMTIKVTKSMHQMIGYAIPVGLEKISMRIGQMVYGSLIVVIGVEHYAAHNIAGTIEAYSYLPAIGFGIASFTMIGHAIGEGRPDSIRDIGRLTYQSATVMMIGIGIVFFIFAPHFASLFTDDPEIHRLVVTVLRMIAFFQPLLASTQVIASSLQALGDVKYPFYLTTLGIWLIRITGTYFLGIRLGMGLIGVWISYCVDITFRGILLYIRFNKKSG